MSKRMSRRGVPAEGPAPRRRVVWRWLLVLGYAAGIFIVSAVPGNALPDLPTNDKLVHAAEFGVLALLLCRALRAQIPTCSPRAIALISVFITIGYGITDEAHQLRVAQRMADLADLVADSGGAVLAALGWLKAGNHWPWVR